MTNESSTSFQLELKLLFSYSADRFARDTSFTGNFSHRRCRISLDAFFDELAVSGGVDCALSAASRTVTSVAVVLEPFDSPPVIWWRDVKLLRSIAVAFLAHVSPKFCF